MPLFRPIRYINDGEPLNETVLNRSTVDVQENLEELFNLVDGYDGGVSEASPLRVVLRDEQGTAKFGVPSNEQHPIRVVEFEDFKEFLLDADDLVRNERLPKASTTLEGIVQLIDSYTDTSLTMAPTADALRRGIESVEIDLATVINEPDARTDKIATTPKAVYDFVSLKGAQWKNDWESYANSAASGAESSAKSYADSKLVEAKTYTDSQIAIADSGGSDIDLAGSVFMNDSRGVSDGLATTPKAVWDAIEAYAGTGGDAPTGTVEVESGGSSSSGWIRFPTTGTSGFLIQWGNAKTGSGGFKTIVFPTSFSTSKYSVSVSERFANGWDFTDGADFYYAPTLYGHFATQSYPSNTQILGVRIVGGNEGEPAPAKGETGLHFDWIAIGE